ncbi:Cytosol aminopeptidase [Fragariocoptes setiger]|uniref:Cytosol aminopeptidase n=1 Tax=Fragariocoptes setiger TaxID=1670756 RepID=A0ABQ7S795_9ACAR|nr:Cytosol aminopeptidase [Fragariocoptes setiger]
MALFKKALVLGAYITESGPTLSKTATHFDSTINGKLSALITKVGPKKKGKARVFYELSQDYPVISVVGLGPNSAGYNEAEDLDEKRENIRSAAAIGARSVRDLDLVEEIYVEACDDPEASAEGAQLALWYFDELKSEKYKKRQVKINYFAGPDATASCHSAWNKGITLASAQNICRRLSEMPANLMTPTIFGKTTVELLHGLNKVKIMVHDKQWCEDKKMGSFLSVAKGSAEPPKFVEIHYNNKPGTDPFVLVGKGICFDSGGISIKPAANMDKMRYDMGGAANVVSTIYALAALNAEVNVIGLAPLCENLPSGTANKPGDVVVAMNGKTIQVDNTDAEGRLILADGLCYAHEFKPQAILDIATLTGAMSVALGSSATGVFTTSTALFDSLRKAGVHTGDRVWRLPLWQHFVPQVTDSQLADCLNIGKASPAGGAATAAAFLKEFVECPNWLHLDIAGVMDCKDECPYLGKGMSGRPVRTLYYFLNNYFNQK